MKFYVSAKWQLKESVDEVIQTIQQRGHTLSEDWRKHQAVKPYDADIKVSQTYASKDVEGVLNADALIHLSDVKGVGMYVELGIALASRRLGGDYPLIYVVGKNTNESQFYFEQSVKRVSTLDKSLSEVTNQIIDEVEEKNPRVMDLTKFLI